MAASDMMSALMELCQEKHIDQLYLIDRLEQSLAKSYAEILHLEWGAKVTIDRTTGKIYVYYKITNGDMYLGGITYRVGTNGLKAGESTTCYAGHFSTDYSKLMFATYVQ